RIIAWRGIELPRIPLRDHAIDTLRFRSTAGALENRKFGAHEVDARGVLPGAVIWICRDRIDAPFVRFYDGVHVAHFVVGHQHDERTLAMLFGRLLNAPAKIAGCLARWRPDPTVIAAVASGGIELLGYFVVVEREPLLLQVIGARGAPSG